MARRRTAAGSKKKTSTARKKTTTARKTKTTTARKTTAAKRKTTAAKRKTTAKRKTAAAPRRPSLRLASLRDVLVAQLGMLRDGEQQLVRALPKVAAAATHPSLREAVEHHLEETREHVKRLDAALGRMRARPPARPNEVMAALIADAERFVYATGDAASKDAALIAAAQRVEHDEIAGYGTARELAGELGLGEVRSLLDETLTEESNTDSLLTRIAAGGLLRSGVNEAAAS